MVCFAVASRSCGSVAYRLDFEREGQKKGDETVTDIVCPHCGKRIRLNIETDPRAILLRVDVTKPKETKER